MTYPCALCDRTLPSAKGRGSHERIVHGDAAQAIHRERDAEYRRRYRLTPQAKAATKRWRLEHPERFKELVTASRRRRATHVQAANAIAGALRYGRMVKQPCAECGAERVEAHHAWGYEPENWLRVVWLCKSHHEDAHHPEMAALKAAS